MIASLLHRESSNPPSSVRSRALPGEGPPTRLDAGRWRAALPEDTWPSGFPVDGLVWRRDVFAVAERWQTGRAGSRQLLAATLMWGASGKSARRRAARTLADDPYGARLDRALNPLRNERNSIVRLRDAYIALRTDCRLNGLDSDAATRLLYFAGYRRGALDVQPLILDSEIAGRIPAEAGVTSGANRGTSLEWVRWICWAAAQAGEHCEPELVEMDLAGGGLRYGARTEPAPSRLPRQFRRRVGAGA